MRKNPQAIFTMMIFLSFVVALLVGAVSYLTNRQVTEVSSDRYLGSEGLPYTVVEGKQTYTLEFTDHKSDPVELSPENPSIPAEDLEGAGFINVQGNAIGLFEGVSRAEAFSIFVLVLAAGVVASFAFAIFIGMKFEGDIDHE